MVTYYKNYYRNYFKKYVLCNQFTESFGENGTRLFFSVALAKKNKKKLVCLSGNKLQNKYVKNLFIEDTKIIWINYPFSKILILVFDYYFFLLQKIKLFSKKKTIENLKKLSYIDISRYDLYGNFNYKFNYKYYDSFKATKKTCLIHLREKDEGNRDIKNYKNYYPLIEYICNKINYDCYLISNNSEFFKELPYDNLINLKLDDSGKKKFFSIIMKSDYFIGSDSGAEIFTYLNPNIKVLIANSVNIVGSWRQIKGQLILPKNIFKDKNCINNDFNELEKYILRGESKGYTLKDNSSIQLLDAFNELRLADHELNNFKKKLNFKKILDKYMKLESTKKRHFNKNISYSDNPGDGDIAESFFNESI
jgi:hypothetical protein